MEQLRDTFLNLYILRHGETDLNRQNIVQGSGINSDINEVGQKQALQLYEQYKNINFDAVYCSALKRTQQTVQRFIEKAPWVEYLSELNEISWGHLEGKEATPERRSEFESLITQWRNGNLDACIEGGESALKLQQRLKKAIKKIHYNHSKGNVLICTHGRSLRVLLCTLFNYELGKMDNFFSHHNTCMNHVIYTGSAYIAVSINDIQHLKD